MPEHTRITVDADDASWLADRLAESGLTVLDTGERVTTDEGVDHEAVLHVMDFETAEEQEASMAGTRLRP